MEPSQVWIRTFTACTLLAFTTLPAVAQTGRITGRAARAESLAALEGAQVTIQGTALGAVTDAEGRFLFQRVPVGTQTLVLTYLGRETQTRQVTVRAGETITVDFTAPVGAVALEGITVLGARALTQAEALTRQKNAANIVNIVASDQMGRFPDASAPEAVQRIPGISIARDQGEGRFIQIRGGSAAQTQVSFNGVEVPSPEGEVRQIALDAVPVDILESIEVSKAILPDMDADAVGGAVNLVTRRAPAGRLFSIEGAGGFAPIRSDVSGSATATFGSRTSDGRFGFLVNGSWSRRSFGSDDVEPVWDLGDEGLADDALEELEVRYYSLRRQRVGATTSLDYRFSETSSIGLRGIYANLTDTEQRRNMLSVIEDDALEWLHKNREENLRTYSIAANGDHLLGGARLDYTLAWTRSLEDTPFDTEINSILEGVSFSPSIDDPDEVRSNPSTIAGDYFFDEIEPGFSNTENTDQVGAANLTLPYQLGDAAGSLKFGFKIRSKNKNQELTEEAYENDGDDLILGTDYGESFGESLKYPADYALPSVGTTPDQVIDFVSRFSSQLDGELNLEAETEDYDLDERVIAAYVMTELNLTPQFMLLPGVRFEQTDVEARGFEFDSETEELTATTAEKDYSQIFPMVHARWEMGPRTNLRGAFTTALARPNFYDLVPYRVRDDEDLALGNPDLEPTISRGFDLLLEHYDERIGVASVGIFYKRLTDPIFIFTEENSLGGDTEQPRNGESGWIRGLEIALQRQIGAGFGIYGNYTFTDSEAELPTGRITTLQGQSDHVFNAAISFERGGLSSQVSANYHNDYVDEYAEDDFEDVWVADHLQFDVSASYQLNQRSTIFLEIVNLTNEPFVAYEGVRERPVQLEYYRAWGRLGVRVNW